jgi:ATP-dependent DNA ligase
MCDEPIIAMPKNNTIPPAAVAALWSETGQEGGKTLRSAPTYISTGKNLGKKNATNILTQSIADALSKWNKNARKNGYVTDKNELGVIQSGRVKPMALQSLPAQAIDDPFNITGTSYWNEGDPMFIAPKSDGNRMMADKNEFWGRSGDNPPNDLAHIRTDLLPFFAKNGDVILDGEIYKHGVPHQIINGLYMNTTSDSSDLQYHVFDVIIPDRDAGYATRLDFLRSELKEAGSSIILVDSTLVKTSEEIETIYKQHLAENYEGSVLRHPEGVYEADGRKEKRSGMVLKLKPIYDSEFEIVGYKGDGKGKESGAIVWILKMPDSDTLFSSRPCETIEKRINLFKQMPDIFESQYNGKMIKVLYGDTTKKGVPRFSRTVGVRILPIAN